MMNTASPSRASRSKKRSPSKSLRLNWDAIIAEHQSSKAKPSAPVASMKKKESLTKESQSTQQSTLKPAKTESTFTKFMKPAKVKTESASSSPSKTTVKRPKPTMRPDEVVATEGMRLNKLVANFSTYSRRQVDALIEAGQVTLNGKRVSELGLWVEKPKNVRIEVKGQLIKTQQRILTVVMNKPKDCITTRRDEKGRRTIYDVLPEELKGLKPVGRLDRNSTGLLLLTNDGDLVNQLTHPKYHLEKVYRVELDKPVADPERLARRFLEGIHLEGESQVAKAVEVFMASPTVWGVTLNTGMYRQVRRMFQACSYDVVALKRIAIGSFQLSGLKPGEWKELRFNEVQALKKSAEQAFKQSEKERRAEARLAKSLASTAKKKSVDEQIDSFLETLDPTLLSEFV